VRILAAIGVFFLFVAWAAPRPAASRADAAVFPGQPLLLRALSGPFHTLLADRYWLLSASVGMARGVGRDDPRYGTFLRAARLVVTLDPRFDAALRYTATYLAAMQGLVDDAQGLCDTAIRLAPAHQEAYLLKVVNEVGYHHPERPELVSATLRALARNTGGVPDWLAGTLAYVRKAQGQRALLRRDLEWLAANTRKPRQRAAIEARLRALDDQRSPPGD